MTLPEDFLTEMHTLLPDEEEYRSFLRSYEGERSYGLRYNPLKLSREAFLTGARLQLQPVPWSREGFFYQNSEQPGKRAWHEAGAFYIQEPSAMIVTELLDPLPGERICDLCAAPGGKSTQIAGRMQGEGLLVSNEIHPARVRILAQNMERMGVRNAVVLNETPASLAARFPVFFDRIVVDAPCSGEGMFRKEEFAVTQWSAQQVTVCAQRQREILEQAAAMLMPGGILVYSTCTFSEAEDEAVITAFLEKHPEFRADETVLTEQFAQAGIAAGKVPGTLRMWPHRLNGEGHFAARLCKQGERAQTGRDTAAESLVMPVKHTSLSNRKAGAGHQKQEEGRRLYEAFCAETLTEQGRAVLQNGQLLWFGEQLYLVPEGMVSLDGLKTERAGLWLGSLLKNRFEPSHSLAMALTPALVRSSFETQDPAGYFMGLSENCQEECKGWSLVLTGGISAGWGKASQGQMKNHYPKGLRREVQV